jgi:hypothetical protein
MALIVGTITFDRLFPASRSAKLMVIFFVYAKNEECAAEMEDSFALHISVIAARTRWLLPSTCITARDNDA